MKRSSPAWEHFEKISNDQVKCKLCNDCLKYKGSTSSMMAHLRSKHPALLQPQVPSTTGSGLSFGASQVASPAAKAPTQQSISSFIAPQRRCNKNRSEAITTLLTKMIAKDLLPVSVVEGCGFRSLMDFVEPEYTVPSHQTMMRRVNKMYGEVKDSLLKILRGQSFVAITTDAWTSLANDSYVTITAHYITKEWKMMSAFLDTSEMEEKHNAENLAIRMQLISMDWDLDGKISACVHDNASNIVAAGELCDEWQDLPCFAHTLQLAINKGFAIADVNALIKAASRLVKFFKKSSQATTALQRFQVRAELPNHRLIQWCKTRWNSLYEMFNRLDEQKSAIQMVLSDKTVISAKKEEEISLIPAQWNKISFLLPTLKALQTATTAMSSEQNTSVSSILPVVCGLRKNHLKEDIDDSPLLWEFEDTVSRELKERFLDNLADDSVSAIAACLDPRHKSLKFLSQDLRTKIHQNVKAMVNIAEDSPERSEDEPAAKKAAVSAMALILGDDYFDESQEHRDAFSHFLQEPPLHPSKEPMEWWQQNEKRFPKLASLARKYLCTPATSVPSGRVFSAAGIIVSKRRCSLLPENVNSLIFLNKNLPK